MKKNEKKSLCVHKKEIGCCLSCEMDFLKENKDKPINGEKMLNIIKLLMNEIRYVESDFMDEIRYVGNEIQEVSDRCPIPYNPQCD